MGFEVRYSALDRMVHTLVMGQLDMQILLSRIEDRCFDRKYMDITAAEPVFIASLPRAGTTLLLELIAGTSDFAAHTYRHLPFVLCPLTWDRLSHRFRRQATMHERAHGDGVFIGYDSVEAIEDILWRAFWPEHFEPDRIRPWRSEEEDREGAFVSFLRQHMRKIVSIARRDGSRRQRRYVSKNNANLARLGWLQRHFPDAVILVPWREPVAHVASLFRQHRNFLALHRRDAFALRYMETIGHLEFGEALRPVDFDGWLTRAGLFSHGKQRASPYMEGCLDSSTPDFWVEYWIAAYSAVLRQAGPRTVLFSYDQLCAAPEASLRLLEARIGLSGELSAQAAQVQAPTSEPGMNIAAIYAQRLEEVRVQLDARSLF